MLLLAIIAFGVPLAVNLSARVNAEVRTQAQGQADLVAATAADLLGPSDRGKLTSLALTAAASVRGRILIVNASGQVLVDSAGTAQIGASYDTQGRPEIEAALAGRQLQVQRLSRTLGQEILATAVPIIRNGGRVVGAVRVTQSIGAVHGAVNRAELGLALIGLIVLGLGLFAGAVIAGQIGGPIKRLDEVAKRVTQGDLRARAEVEGSREQRSLASSFNEMTARVARLLDVQRDFVADASHQLRTPLTGLRLRLEEAKVVAREPEANAELDAAIREVDRLSHTVDELLLLSRAGERRPTGALIDLDDLAASARHRWKASAMDRGIRLAHQREAGAGSTWASLHDLERVLDALLENALRYSPAGEMVTIASGPGRIEIRDRGPGVAPDERELVFERFHRGRAGRSGPPGSGLGLAISRELARAWDGEVTITDRGGGGATATLSFPACFSPGVIGDAALPPLNSSGASV